MTDLAPTASSTSTTTGDEDALNWHETHASDVAEAKELKSEGNQAFTSNDYEGAIKLYTEAIAHLPRRPANEDKGKARASEADEEDQVEAKDIDEDDEEGFVPLPLAREVRDLRAALHANVAVCHMKLERWRETVDWCTEALRDDPCYVKALQRRATANERLATWSSLASALEDQKTLFSLPGLPASQTAQAKAAISRLPPLIEKRRAAETAEMMGKLKELGNSFLGKFGMSTENFGFTPNGEGGYSMNMKR